MRHRTVWLLVTTILLANKLSRKHRGAAIGLMIAANVAYASAVAYNYRQSSR